MKHVTLTRHACRNGLTVLYGRVPESAGFEIAMQIDTGTRDETQRTNGVSHFLEHMMFRGCEGHPDSLSLARAMEDIGGETNAMTSTENTVYWMRGARRKFEPGIALFARFFLTPAFSDLDTERSIILQELANDYNENGDLVDVETLAMQALFPDHPLGLPIIGTEKVLKALTLDDLREKHRTTYVPDRCVLTVMGSLPEEIVFQRAEELFGGSWGNENGQGTLRSRRLPVPAQLIPGPAASSMDALQLQNNTDNQYAVKVAFPTSGGSDAAVVRHTMLQRLLDDGISSRLPSSVRERHGLVYDIACDLNTYSDFGVFSVDVTVAEDLLPALLERLGEELRRILTEPPSEDEMERLRFRYTFDLDMIHETPTRYVSREAWNTFLPGALSLESERAVVAQVTPDDLVATAREIFLSPRRAFVLVGPAARKKRLIVEKFLNTLR